jgi:hypothetical protein
MKYSEQQKAQMIRDAEDEIAVLQNGITCSPKHIKRYCRNRIMYLNWVISRVSRGMDIDNIPTTIYCPPRPPLQVLYTR